jgi:glycosyltransferase involved in cell wall biosynthesis
MLFEPNGDTARPVSNSPDTDRQDNGVKILFLAGSLEPGRDGVGDYTRTLATECARLGHETFLLSLNDPWVHGPLLEPALLRLGSKMSWPERVRTARAFLKANRVEIVSLQFVPYSFHPAGLNFAFPQILSAIIGQRRVQLVFHELWVGAQTGAPVKVKVLGFCQRKIIEAVVKTSACRTIHTSNFVYVQLLARHGINARQLSLFGSVPVIPTDNLPRQRDDILRLGIFGSIHPEWSPDEMLGKLQKLGKQIQLSHIGRIGRGESVWMDLAERYGLEIELRRLGAQSLDSISRFFSSIDFGVATTPLSLIGKSASVAAMLDHGLPVIVNRNDVHFYGITDTGPTSDLLIPVDEMFLERLTTIKRRAPRARLPEVAAQFLHDIGA